MKNIHEHFSIIAPKYTKLRTTDLEPIFSIKKYLHNYKKIKAADIGCGCGRYTSKLFQYLKNKILLFYCIDTNEEMLEQLKEYLAQDKILNFQPIRALAKNLPLQNNSLHCMFNFNAIHHFKNSDFLNESLRVLRERSYLFIYTRSRSQNRRNIWGKYFPLFNQKETRLYEIDEFKNILEKIPGLELQETESFKYKRISTLDWLIEQACNHHYSTFSLYTNVEFNNSLTKFKQNLIRHFSDLNNINWFNENILYVIRKQKLNRHKTNSVKKR